MKSSDAQLHEIAKVEAQKHSASFLGPAATYKYGLFQLTDGRQVEIHLYHVRDGKWPKNIELFLARQALSRGRNRSKMLTHLRELAQHGGSELLDMQWEGPHHWYSFKIPDGRVVKIRGSKLITSGWPVDVDAYLVWSQARCQVGAEPKSREALFQEFKAEVEKNNAVVLTQQWLGARTPHHILLSDGTVRKLKPNQLKYFGWPVVPLDELRKMAAPYPVHILPDTADQETQLFRINVSCGVYLEGSFAELKGLWDDAPGLIAEATEWAAQNGLCMAPAKWRGVLAEYEFVTEKGATVWHHLPAAQAHLAQRESDAELAKLRRVGTMNGAKLLATTFEGKNAVYAWETAGKVVTATMQQLVDAARQQTKFAALESRVKAVGLSAVLLSTEWQGMCAAYQWRLENGTEVTAKLSQLRILARKQVSAAGVPVAPTLSRTEEVTVFQTGAGDQALEILRDWAGGVGIKLLSTNWVDPGANYEWALPDGTIVAASLKKVRNCTRAVLRQRDGIDLPAEPAALTKQECDTLLDRISNSKSR